MQRFDTEWYESIYWIELPRSIRIDLIEIISNRTRPKEENCSTNTNSIRFDFIYKGVPKTDFKEVKWKKKSKGEQNPIFCPKIPIFFSKIDLFWEKSVSQGGQLPSSAPPWVRPYLYRYFIDTIRSLIRYIDLESIYESICVCTLLVFTIVSTSHHSLSLQHSASL